MEVRECPKQADITGEFHTSLARHKALTNKISLVLMFIKLTMSFTVFRVAQSVPL